MKRREAKGEWQAAGPLRLLPQASGHVQPGGGMDVRSKVYSYRTTVKWTERRKGTMSCTGKPDVQVATPPEFKGHDGIWSPEDLFVASANICLMTTFLAVAERAGLAFSSYESVAEGRLESVEGKFQFSTITIRPTIVLKAGSEAARAKELIEKAEANCLISNSMKARVSLEPVIQ
jgi:peroxiredoxin-like protein